VNRPLRLLAVVALVLGGGQLLTPPAASALLAEPVVLDASSASVPYAKQLVLTATVAAPQPDSQVDFYAKVDGGPAKTIGTATLGGDATAKLSLAVNHSATYFAVLMVAGVATSQSASVGVVVAPLLKLTATRVIGPVYHFNATVVPGVDGIPVVLQRLVGKKWKKIEKDFTSDGEIIFNAEIPSDAASTWRLYVRGGKKWGGSTSKAVRVIDY
jgi:hypothetical protein